MAIFKKNRQFNIKAKSPKEINEDQEKDIQSKWHELKQTRTRKSSILSSPLYMVLFLLALIVLWYFLSGYE